MADRQSVGENPRDQVFLALTSTSLRDVSEVVAKYRPIGWDVKVERVGSTWLVMLHRPDRSNPTAT